MQERDGRSIPDAALEVLRERAVAMHEAGNTQLAIASALGVHKNTVHRWLKGWRNAGAGALKAKKRGRRQEAQRLLNATQAAEVQQLMTEHCPDQLELPFALWGREAVRDLVQTRFGVRLALRTVSDYLHRWGFTPQRPIRRASERQDAAVQAWLAEHYPKIAARAKAEGAEIHWGDETGISNQAAYGRSFAPKGRTPVIRRTARRHTTSMISTVTNRGTLRFMLYEGALNAALFLAFLQRLVRGARRKVFLIVDNLKVHKAGKVQAWVAEHRERLELFFLPAYAPEHNPDEFLHNDLNSPLPNAPISSRGLAGS
jgi:transposase